MSAYFIANYNITDRTLYKEYLEKSGPLVNKYGGKLSALSPKGETVEGSTAAMMVIIEFDSEQTAQDWYNDTEYQEVAKLRHSSTEDGFARIVPSFAMKG